MKEHVDTAHVLRDEEFLMKRADCEMQKETPNHIRSIGISSAARMIQL